MRTRWLTIRGDFGDDGPVDDEGVRGFEELGELGRGGMGTVLRVFDPRIGRQAAMKRVDPSSGGDRSALRRFVQEARITGQLEHPNVVPVHEFGTDEEGRLYLNMKLVRGRTLAELVSEAGAARLEPRRLAGLLEVLIRVCDAVAYAHSRGVIHRDLKPSNVMVGEFGQVYVMDWGIARVFATDAADATADRPDPVRVHDQVDDPPDQLIGTPAYMAPEQAEARHDDVDCRTDVFALGAMLYFVLAGHGPYGEGPTMGMLFKASAGRIRPLDELREVPRSLARIAMRAMALAPDDRYPSALAMRQELEDFLHGTWQLREVRIPAGVVFVREGEPGTVAYIIQDGRCAVFTRSGGARRVLRELGPGEVFGETSVIAGAPRTASVEALTPLVLLEVDREALEVGLGLNGWMGAFVRALAERFVEVDRLRR